MLVALGVLAVGGGLTACSGTPASGGAASGGSSAPVGAATAAPGVTGTTPRVASASADCVVVVAPASADFVSGSIPAVLLAGTATVATTKVAYDAVDGVDRQLQYVLKHWKDYNPEYQPLGSTDCVDFMSQSLLERGWKEQGAWTHADAVASSGGAWISSTLFRDFMTAHPELGSPLTDDERSKVRLGDVVQFDWDGTGDRDHTGVVTRVVTEGGRTRIGFAGHTLDSDYRDVDTAITVDHPGGAAYYWSLA